MKTQRNPLTQLDVSRNDLLIAELSHLISSSFDGSSTKGNEHAYASGGLTQSWDALFSSVDNICPENFRTAFEVWSALNREHRLSLLEMFYHTHPTASSIRCRMSRTLAFCKFFTDEFVHVIVAYAP